MAELFGAVRRSRARWVSEPAFREAMAPWNARGQSNGQRPVLFILRRLGEELARRVVALIAEGFETLEQILPAIARRGFQRLGWNAHRDGRPVLFVVGHEHHTVSRILLQHRKILAFGRADKILPLKLEHFAARRAHELAGREGARGEERGRQDREAGREEEGTEHERGERVTANCEDAQARRFPAELRVFFPLAQRPFCRTIAGPQQSGQTSKNGWVAEWSNAHAWKACLPKGNGGSNPSPSATSDFQSKLAKSGSENVKILKVILKCATRLWDVH